MLSTTPSLFQAFRNATVLIAHNRSKYINSLFLLKGILQEGSTPAAAELRRYVQLSNVLDSYIAVREDAPELYELEIGDRENEHVSCQVTQDVYEAFCGASEHSGRINTTLLTTEMLLLHLMKSVRVNKLMNTAMVDTGDMKSRLKKQAESIKDDYCDTAPPASEVRISTTSGTAVRLPTSGSTPALDQYSIDLTELARQRKLMPCIGRADEIRRVIQVLQRKTKNNPVLLGEAGVGKTAVVEGLALRIAAGLVPKKLLTKRIVALDLFGMTAGTSHRGEFEQRLKAVIAEVKKAEGEIIVFLDELHTLIGAGRAGNDMGDASNALKPALSRGEFPTIGATTFDEYRKYIEKNAALARRFKPIEVSEPTVDECVQILFGLRQTFEEHHGILIDDDALTAAAQLSARYVTDRFLPDKAIDLIDDAASQFGFTLDESIASGRQYTGVPTLTANDVALLLSKQTGIPVADLTEAEVSKLINLETRIADRVVGHPLAINKMARAVRRARAGLSDPRRPVGVFLLLGPTGVGKTELALALQEALFGGHSELLRIDMSEFGEKGSISGLIGAPAGYIGYDDVGRFDSVRRRPYCVILLDEIEKAHDDVHNLLLQVFDNGAVVDRQGRKINFKNTVIIMTSNVGAQYSQGNSIGFGDTGSNDERDWNKALKSAFKPEFLNRVDVISLAKLTEVQIREILSRMVREVDARLSPRGISIKLTELAQEYLIARGYDQQYGARPLRRAVEHYLEDPIADALLVGAITSGDEVEFDVNEDRLELKRVSQPPSVEAEFAVTTGQTEARASS